MVMSSVRTSLLWSVEIRKVWRELFYHLEVKTCFLYHSFSYNAHAVSHQLHTRKIVGILEPVVSADKYQSIFSCQMEAIFFYKYVRYVSVIPSTVRFHTHLIGFKYSCARSRHRGSWWKQEVKLKKLKKRLISKVRYHLHLWKKFHKLSQFTCTTTMMTYFDIGLYLLCILTITLHLFVL